MHSDDSHREAPAFEKIDDAARGFFEHHGVVCLRGAVGEACLRRAREGIADSMARPGPFFRDQTPADSPARYVFDYWNWQRVEGLRWLVCESDLAARVARLLGASTLNLLMDNWFVREAGATNGAPWHHDEPYFDFDGGRMVVLWFPLETATHDEGLTFLSGSHRWGRLYMPQNFREHRPFDGDLSAYHSTDDVESSDAPRLAWSMEPGDCLVFDFRTLHRATNARDPLSRTIHRLSLRYGDGDVRFRPRGAWTEEITRHLVARGQRVDAPIDCDLLPRVFPPPGLTRGPA